MRPPVIPTNHPMKNQISRLPLPPARGNSSRRGAVGRLAAVLATAAVFSATVYATPPETVRHQRLSYFPNNHDAWTSHWGVNSNYGWQVFSPVTFDTPETLTGIAWTGTYLRDAGNELFPASPNTLDWTILIHADDGGKPASDSLYSFTVSASAVTVRQLGLMTFWGISSQTGLSEFQTDFPAPFQVEADQRYWVSVLSRGTTFRPFFSWTDGAEDRNEARFPADSQYRDTESSWQAAAKSNSAADPGLRSRGRALTLLGYPTNDLDQDGMDDSWESDHGLDPDADDHAEDPDEDGATHLQEFERGSDPHLADTDGDGLLDGVETNRGSYVDANDTGTHPLLPDTDRDGLLDGEESPTPGGDSLSLSDPNTSDTDRDGYEDSVEILNGFDPSSGASFPAPIDLGTGAEALLGSDLTDPENDADADLLSGFNAEIENISDPLVPGAHNLFDNRLGSEDDHWCCDRPGPGVLITFEEPVILERFTIASGSNPSDLAPRHFALRGSNDGGKTWHNIYTRANKSEMIWSEPYQVLEFDAGLHYRRPQAFRTFRFSSIGNGKLGDALGFEVGELELFGSTYPLKIKHLNRGSDGGMELSWFSIPEATYTIEGSPDLHSWSEIAAGIPSAGTHTSFLEDPIPSEPLSAAFYRVREE